MKKVLVSLLSFGLSGLARAADGKADAEKRLNSAADVLQEIMKAPDKRYSPGCADEC